jgi:hypothetical protein
VIDGVRLISDVSPGLALLDCLVAGAQGCPISILAGYHPRGDKTAASRGMLSKAARAAVAPSQLLHATLANAAAAVAAASAAPAKVAPISAPSIRSSKPGGGATAAAGDDELPDGDSSDSDATAAEEETESGAAGGKVAARVAGAAAASADDDDNDDDDGTAAAAWCALPASIPKNQAIVVRLRPLTRGDAAEVVRRYLAVSHKSLWERHPVHGDQMDIVLAKPRAANARYLLRLCELATMCGSFSGLSQFLRDAPNRVRQIKDRLVMLRRSDYILSQDVFDVSRWLDGLGMGQYAESFRAAHIDTKAQCAALTDAVLRDEIGVPPGHRVLLLNAIKTIGHAGRHEFGYDVFVSYRVSTDADHASKIALLLKSGDVAAAGAPGPRRVRAFLDVFELKLAEDWEKGFERGLKESLLFVPLLSDASMRSIAEMAAAGKKDNVLLELELAIARKMPIMPLLVGSVDAAGLYREFSAFDLSVFPDAASQTSDVHVSRTMQAIMKKQGVKVNPRDLSSVITKVISTVKSLLDSHAEDQNKEEAG